MAISSISQAQSIIKAGVCTSTTRPASPYDGQVIYETDTDKTLVYNGTGWVFLSTSRANSVGLDLISTGTFTTSSTVSLPTGTFTSTYSNYRLIVNVTNSSLCALNFRYRISGTDYSGATYQNCGFTVTTGGTIANDGISGSSQTSNKAGYLGNSPSDNPVVTIELYRPNEAIETRFSSRTLSVNSTASVVADNHCGGVVYQTTQYDSITLIPSAGTITGTYSVYGYAK